MSSKRNTTAIIAALISLIGGIFTGYMVQKLTTERSIYVERLKNVNALRSQAYMLFFDAVANYNQARNFGYEGYGDLFTKEINDSLLYKRIENVLWDYHSKMKKARIMLAASAPTSVIESLVQYFRERYDHDEAEETWEYDARTYLELREELLKDIEEKKVSAEDMYLLMFDDDPLERKDSLTRSNELIEGN